MLISLLVVNMTNDPKQGGGNLKASVLVLNDLAEKQNKFWIQTALRCSNHFIMLLEVIGLNGYNSSIL